MYLSDAKSSHRKYKLKNEDLLLKYFYHVHPYLLLNKERYFLNEHGDYNASWSA